MRQETLTVEYLLKTKVRKILFAPLPKRYAWATEGIVALDPRVQTPLARSLLHELLHIRRPTWSETKIMLEERRLWKTISWREQAALYQMVGRGRPMERDELDEEGEVEDAGSAGSILHGAGADVGGQPAAPRGGGVEERGHTDEEPPR